MATVEETMALLAQKAQEAGDNFSIKVYRTRPGMMLGSHVATFADASVSHVANPERWLPGLLGSGKYHLHIYHAKDDVKPIGAMIPLDFQGASVEKDAQGMQDAMRSPAFWGPGTLVHPKPPELPATPAVFTPPSVSSSYTAQAASVGSPTVNDPFAAQRLAELSRIESEMRAAQVALAERERKLEMERAEERHTAQLEKLRMEQEKRDAELRAELKANRQEGPKLDIAGLVTGLIAAATPIFQAVMSTSAERAKVEAENRKAEREEARRQHEQTLAALKERGPDPMLIELKAKMEAMAAQRPNMEFEKLTSAITSLAMTQLDMAKEVMEMTAGPQEPALVTAMKEGAKAIGEIMKGAAKPSPINPQAWGGPPPQNVQRMPAPAPQAPAQVIPLQRAVGAPAFNGPPASAPGMNAPPAAPAPVQEVLPPEADQADNEEGEEIWSVVDDIMQRLFEHREPPAMIAHRIVSAIQNKDPGMMQALAESNGDLIAFMAGYPWVDPKDNTDKTAEDWAKDPQNLAFLQELNAAFAQMRPAAGL